MMNAPLALEDHPAIEAQLTKVMTLIDRGLKSRDAGVGPRGDAIVTSRLAQAKTDLIRQAYAANPQATVEGLAQRFGCNRSLVRAIRNELGLPVAGNTFHGKNLRERYKALLAEHGQISNAEAAARLGCSDSTISQIKRKIAYEAE
jgi:hypothetical protein